MNTPKEVMSKEEYEKMMKEFIEREKEKGIEIKITEEEFMKQNCCGN